MLRTRGVLFCVLLSAWIFFGGCKCEGSSVRKALDKFVGFAQGEDYTKGQAEKSLPYKVRSRREESHRSRSRVIAHVEVDPGIDHATLKEVLRDACHDESIARGTSVLKVVAWPGSLQRLVAPLGTSVFARDGHGWEGTGVGFEEIHVALPTPEQLHARGLTPLSEKEYLRAMTVDAMIGRGKTIQEAISSTTSYHNVSETEVRAAIQHAQQLFGRPK